MALTLIHEAQHHAGYTDDLKGDGVPERALQCYVEYQKTDALEPVGGNGNGGGGGGGSDDDWTDDDNGSTGGEDEEEKEESSSCALGSASFRSKSIAVCNGQ